MTQRVATVIWVTHVLLSHYALLYILKSHNHNANMCTITWTLISDWINMQNQFTIKMELLFAVAHCQLRGLVSIG